MMNNGQPAVPMYPGRRQHEIPYNAPPQPPYPHPYHGYHHQHIPQHYHPQPPPQWAYYNMQAPMQRPYPPYPPMMNAPYPMPPPQNPPSMSPRPNPPQHTPSPASVRSHHGVYSPPAQEMHPPPPQRSTSATQPSPSLAHPAVSQRMPFYAPLPWYSVPEAEFPPRSSRRRRTFAPQSPSLPVELPAREDDVETKETSGVGQDSKELSDDDGNAIDISDPAPEPISSDTTTASIAASDTDSTQPTTPSSTVTPRLPNSSSSGRQPGKLHPIVPVVPIIPALSRANKIIADSATSDHKSSDSVAPSDTDIAARTVQLPTQAKIDEGAAATEEISKPLLQEPKATPKSWADLVRSKAPSNGYEPIRTASESSATRVNGHPVTKSDSIADTLLSYRVRSRESDNKIAFLKPRGLVNTGNMCYMNSVLQVLVFCVPFYDLLDQVGKKAVHSFKSDTPMVDAMIMFLREFPVIDSAISAESLNLRLKDKELEEYGEPFSPEYVYEVIRRLPRFSSMRRGHQQDAEEFLGFLLEELHEECVRAMKGMESKGIEEGKSPVSESLKSDDNGWLEVGPRQRAAITRSSGIVEAESPITKIFGGNLRSEFRVPGHKNSVTLEQYQPLQLDIGSPHVNNITDALKGLTKSETLHGDFNSPRGPGVSATKQVFVETLPPVLILHLKRFQYDNAGGTQKIWKKVGYPLDLEIPKEVFPPHKRGGLVAHGGLPKYRLIAVVYHHGKNASGGHYTVDVRRQNDREWIRIDDTVIRRIRSEEVAEGGSEEDPKVLAIALEQHKRDQSTSSNIFDQVREEKEESEQAEIGWSQVNGATQTPLSAPKKWSGVVNGTVTPTPSSGMRTPVGRYSVKDNKVAYILFYQKIGY